jgi:signal transduction histidine kinase
MSQIVTDLSSMLSHSSEILPPSKHGNWPVPKMAPDSQLFAEIFPFHFVLDEKLKIIQLGAVLQRLYPQIEYKSDFNNHFFIRYPHVDNNLTIQELVLCQNSNFLICSRSNNMSLSGQISSLPAANAIVFLGTPWMSHISKLSEYGLDVSDFPIHDRISDAACLIELQQRVLAQSKKITKELSKQKDEIQAALKKEQELSEIKSRFITMASHEFRTPLGIISSSTGLLEDYDEKFDLIKKTKHWHRIQQAVKHMTRLLEDILIVEQSEAGKIQFNPAEIDLPNFLSELVEEVAIAMDIEDKFTIELPTPISLSPPAEISMDEKLLRQIFTNLLSNAAKYSFRESQVNISLTITQNRAIVKVKDRGIGIPLEDRQRLFQFFHRCNNVNNIQGTGLGLSIVKRCVELHGGTIEFTSEVNIGTTFTVNLPLYSSPQ